MRISKLIKELEKFREQYGNKEVIFSDGYGLHFHHSKTILFSLFDGKCDIGLGACNEDEDCDNDPYKLAHE